MPHAAFSNRRPSLHARTWGCAACVGAPQALKAHAPAFDADEHERMALLRDRFAEAARREAEAKQDAELLALIKQHNQQHKGRCAPRCYAACAAACAARHAQRKDMHAGTSRGYGGMHARRRHGRVRTKGTHGCVGVAVLSPSSPRADA